MNSNTLVFLSHGLLLLAGILSTGCLQADRQVADAFHLESQQIVVACDVDQPFPYPPHSPSLGVHANAQNNDIVDCATHDRFAQAWHVLQGQIIGQPNTFSPDGKTTYVTTGNPEKGGCRVYALDVADGSTVWCRSYPFSVVASSVEVDLDGYLYITYDDQIVSLDGQGNERWRTTINVEGGSVVEVDRTIGLHFTPDGFIATSTNSGVVVLVARDSGAVLSTLSIPASWGFVPLEPFKLSTPIGKLVPEEPRKDLSNLMGLEGQELDDRIQEFFDAFMGNSGGFSDNTIAVSPRNELYIIGGGPDGGHGALVQVLIEGPVTAPVLRAGWYVVTTKGSATSASVSPDGRWVNVGDGAGLEAFLDPASSKGRILTIDIDACDQSTQAITEATERACHADSILELERRPAAGSLPMDDNGLSYIFEVDFESGAHESRIDIRAQDADGLVWETVLPDGLTWSSVVTVTRNHLIGTASLLTPGDESILIIDLPATAEHYLLILDRNNGEVVQQLPISDDTSSTVTVGSDGSLYANLVGLLSVLATDTPATAGLVHYVPIK